MFDLPHSETITGALGEGNEIPHQKRAGPTEPALREELERLGVDLGVGVHHECRHAYWGLDGEGWG